jgi:hypothetical protein
MKTIFHTLTGKEIFVLSGQSHNSSTYSKIDLNVFWKALDALNANTAEIPIYWEAIEPAEGSFDFSSVDTVFAQARVHKKYLVLLWFGTWKNGGMRYTPSWVKQDTNRFKRVISHDGNKLFVLSSHCAENLNADKKAFCALMKHLKEINTDGTLLAVQVENEPAISGRSYRDFSEQGEADYRSVVPPKLIDCIAGAPDSALYKQWDAKGKQRNADWEKTFGVKCGAENVSAYSIATFIDKIAEAGKAAYDIPLYVNAALDGYPYGWNLPGINYGGGGPIPRLYEIWKFATPHIDLLAPDIYLSGRDIYERVCARYNNANNALFVPESSPRGADGNIKNMYYAIGKYDAIGYAAFGIESILDKDGTVSDDSKELVNSFQSVSYALPLLIKYRGTGNIHAVVQEEFEDGSFFETEKYIVKIDYSKTGYSNYIHHALNETPARSRGLVVQGDNANEFYVLGTGLTVYFARKDDIFYSEDIVTNHMSYLFVEEGHFDSDDKWVIDRIRTGDEADHGIWVFTENKVVHVVVCE